MMKRGHMTNSVVQKKQAQKFLKPQEQRYRQCLLEVCP